MIKSDTLQSSMRRNGIHNIGNISNHSPKAALKRNSSPSLRNTSHTRHATSRGMALAKTVYSQSRRQRSALRDVCIKWVYSRGRFSRKKSLYAPQQAFICSHTTECFSFSLNQHRITVISFCKNISVLQESHMCNKTTIAPLGTFSNASYFNMRTNNYEMLYWKT